MAKVKSSKVAILIKTASNAWSRMSKGISAVPISYGVKTTTETNVDEDNATTSVDGYEISTDIEQIAEKGDPIFDYVDNIRKNLLTGSDCETEAVIVNIYEGTTESGGQITCNNQQKFGATIIITDYELKGGECVRIKYKVALNGDPKTANVTVNTDKSITVS